MQNLSDVRASCMQDTGTVIGLPSVAALRFSGQPESALAVCGGLQALIAVLCVPFQTCSSLFVPGCWIVPLLLLVPWQQSAAAEGCSGSCMAG